jgi:hypothetical protein
MSVSSISGLRYNQVIAPAFKGQCDVARGVAQKKWQVLAGSADKLPKGEPRLAQPLLGIFTNPNPELRLPKA